MRYKISNLIYSSFLIVQFHFPVGEPVFTKPLVKDTIKDYEDATLKVRCDGVPAPQVVWYKDGRELSNDERHTISSEVKGTVESVLEIKHFEASDAGRVRTISRY